MALPPKRSSLPSKVEGVDLPEKTSLEEVVELKVVDEVVRLGASLEEEIEDIEEPLKKTKAKSNKKLLKKKGRKAAGNIVLEEDSQETKKRFYPSDEKKLKMSEMAHAITGELEDDALEYKDPSIESQWEEGGKAVRKIPVGWVFLAVLCVLAVAGFSLNKLIKGDRVLSEKQIVMSKERAEEQRLDNEDSDALYANVNDVLESFFSAKTVDDVLAVCRHPERVRPLIEKYYSEHPFDPQPLEKVTGLSPIALGKDSLGRKSFIVVSAKVGQGKRHIMLEQMPGNTVLADWESAVCYQDMDWERYIDERPSEAMDFRVRISPDDFYTYEFANEDKYQNYFIQVDDRAKRLFGYIERSDPGYKELQRICKGLSGRASSAVILKLRFPEGGEAKNAVIIEEVLQDGWTYDLNPDEQVQEN